MNRGDIDLGELLEVDVDQHSGKVKANGYKFIGQRLLVPRSLFGHMHIRGMTGSGKTSLDLVDLACQFMQPYEVVRNDASTGVVQEPIFIFDLGGDSNFFWNVHDQAKSLGRTFRYLTLDDELDSFLFPPFQAVGTSGEGNALKISQMLVQAFSMDHGLVYGGSYYSQQNLAALLRVARQLTQTGGEASLEDVARYLDDPHNKREFKDADSVRMTFQFLEQYSQLSRGRSSDEEIDIDRAIENGEVIYFFTPTLAEPLTARLVAGLGLFSVITVAMRRKKLNKSLPPIRILVDEFYEVVGRSLAALFAQSRKFSASLICANQSTSQLNNRDLSLSDQVFEGTAVKRYYTSLGSDVEVLQSLSKEARRFRGTKGGHSVTAQEVMLPALDRDTILDVSYAFGRSFVVINDGTGHREPLVVQQQHRYPDHSLRPMPARKLPVVRATRQGWSKDIPLDDAERVERHEAIRAIIATKVKNEIWK